MLMTTREWHVDRLFRPDLRVEDGAGAGAGKGLITLKESERAAGSGRFGVVVLNCEVSEKRKKLVFDLWIRGEVK
jgi:hypothetical protein